MSEKIFDKNGVELKEGDFFYYTELPFSNYADSLNQVVRHPESMALGSHTVVGNDFGKYRVSDVKYFIPFKYHAHEEGRIIDSEKVEVIGDPIEFMNKNYPLFRKRRLG